MRSYAMFGIYCLGLILGTALLTADIAADEAAGWRHLGYLLGVVICAASALRHAKEAPR